MLKFSSKKEAIQHLANISGKSIKVAGVSEFDLKKIKILFMDDRGSLTLWGIPYDMRQGQQPIDLQRAENTKDWINLGVPGAEKENITSFLNTLEDIPTHPGEWTEVEFKESSKTASESLLYSIITPKEFNDSKKKMDEQTSKLATQIMMKLAKELKLTDSQNEAINRLKQTINNDFNESMNRNNIFKAAHALGIKLPSSSF